MRIVASALREPSLDRESPDWPDVSVVLASRESPDLLIRRIENLLESAYPPEKLQVVVALDPKGHTSPPMVACDDSRVRVLSGDAPGGKAATLNAGVRAATGSVLVLTDTHQRFDVEAVHHLAHALRSHRVGIVSGRLELPEGAQSSLVERYWRVERRLRRDEAVVHSAVGVTGAIYAMRRSLWSPLPEGLILDDLYVPMRLVLAGHRVGFADDARAFETRRTEPGQEYRRKVRTLTGNFQLCAWLPGVLVPGRNPIWPQFVFHKLLRLLTPWILAVGVLAALVALVRLGGWAVLLGVAGFFLLAAALAAVSGQWRRLRATIAWGLSMQLAIVVATINGLTGRWDVWRR